MKLYGLIGKALSHSFSPTYFSNKFKSNGIDAKYEAFELASISDFQQLVQSKEIHGLNVTIPYKEAIIPYLDKLSPEASAIGAVNTIQFNGKHLIGHNTDWQGFWNDASPFLKNTRRKALILGTGGSSKAVQFALQKHNWIVDFVSSSNQAYFNYSDLNQNLISDYGLIVNTTPLGMFPDISSKPEFPISSLQKHHIVYDLIYNPRETRLLKDCRIQGATIKNGYGMLLKQAELSYAIWQENISDSPYKNH